MIELQPEDQWHYFYELASGSSQVEAASWLQPSVTYHFNDDSLNEIKNYQPGVHDGVIRIVTVGDSFTFGMYVDTENSWPKQLERLLQQQQLCGGLLEYEVINLGVPGYDLNYTAHRFIQKGAKYNPDLVIAFLRDDDFFLDNEKFREREDFFRHELESSESSKKYAVEANEKYPETRFAYQEFIEAFNGLSAEERQQQIEQEAHWFSNMTAVFPGPYLIFTAPRTPEIYVNKMKELSRQARNSFFLESIHEFKTFDPYDYHPTTEGHASIAKDIAAHLEIQKSQFCPQPNLN